MSDIRMGFTYTLGASTSLYAEGTSTGGLIGAVRNDTLAALADGDNEIAPLQVNATGALYIQEGTALDVSGATLTVNAHAVTNAGTFVVQEDGAALTALQLIDDIIYVDDTATHTSASSKGAGIMAAATPTDGSVDVNDIGMLAMSLDRRLHVDADIVASTGGALAVTGTITAVTSITNTVTVDGTGVFAVQVDGAALTALQLIDDCVYTDDDDWTNDTSKHLLVGGLYASGAPNTITDGDVGPVAIDTNGHLQVDVLSGGGSSTPTSPVIDVVDADTPTTIAPATPTNVDSPDLTTKKLSQAVIASTVPFKVVISTLSGGAATTKAVRMGGPGNGGDVVWDTPHIDYAVCGTTVGGFRARITNLDPADTADFYVSWAYED